MLPKKSGQDSESQHQLAEHAQLARWATFSAIWEWDVEKKLFWSSPGNQLLFGRGDGEVTESFDPDDDEDPWGSRLHPDDRARVLQSVRDHLKNDAPYDLEYRYLLPDGEYKWVRSVGHAFRAPDGKPLRLIGMNIAISDPNLAEAKRETEAGLSAILENSPIAIIWKDVDGRYEYGNSVWLNRHGLTSAQIRGKTVQDFFPVSSDLIAEQDRKLLEAKETVQFEYEEVLDGQTTWFIATKFPVLDAFGQVTSIVTMEIDITDRKITEHKLQLSEALLADAQRLAHIGSWTWDFSTDELQWSDEHYRIFGVEPMGRKVTYDDFSSLLHPDDRQAVADAIKISTDQRTGYDMVFRIVRRDGETRIIHAWGEARFDDAQKPVHIGGAVQDITELKRAEDDLRVSEARLVEAQQIANVGSWALDMEELGQSRTHWSAELCNIYGIEQSAVPQDFDAYLRLVHEEDRDLVVRSWTSAVESKTPYELEHRIVRSDGGVRFIYTKSRAFQDVSLGAVRMVGASTDITERKLAEEKLQQAQKMEAVGQLTGGVAHDFNNLLTVILGNLELVRDRVSADSNEGAMIARGLEAAERGAALTHRLLAFSRNQTLMPTTIDLGNLVAGMTDMLRRTLGETIEIHTKSAANLWRCLADQSQLENALLNLSINARDAMKGGGRLTIETENISLDDDFAAAQAEVAPGHYIMLAVSDTGSGIASDVLSHVFEPFFTTKNVGQGSGLGLSMVYGFAKQSGGNVTIYSEMDRGTTVKLYLPRSFAQDGEDIHARSNSSVPEARGETIFVVEDDPDVRTLAVALLSGLGYNIVEAGDGETALEVLQHSGTIDLLLSDVVLPGAMNGPDLAAEIRRRSPNTRIVYMTGYAKEAFSNYTDLEEGAHVIQKPFKRADLASVTRSVLDGEKP